MRVVIFAMLLCGIFTGVRFVAEMDAQLHFCIAAITAGLLTWRIKLELFRSKRRAR